MIHRSTQAKNGNASDTNPSLSPKTRGEPKMSKFGKYFLLATGFALVASFPAFQGPTSMFMPTIASAALPVSKGPMPSAGRA